MNRITRAAGAFVLAIFLFGCGDSHQDITSPPDAQPDENRIMSFRLDGQAENAVIGEYTINVSVEEGTDLSSVIPRIHISDKAALFPVTEAYLERMFSNISPREALARINEAADLDACLKDMIENEPNFKVPELDMPIDFSVPVCFLVMSEKGAARMYSVRIFTVRQNGECIVTFDGTGGSPAQTKLHSGQGKTVGSLLSSYIPSWSGYVFNGWNTSADGTGTPFTEDTPITGDITVYAQWEPTDSYTVTFNSNGGIPEMVTRVVEVGATVGENMPVPTRDGYTLADWSIPWTGLPFTATSPVIRNITVFARWKRLLPEPDLDMAWIQPGTFTMGSPETEPGRTANEIQHSVTLTQGFYMGKYPVTQAQYEAVMGSLPIGKYNNGNEDNYPVYGANWYEVIVFCNRLSMREGLSPAYSISGSTDPTDWGDVPASSDAGWDAVTVVTGSTGYRLPTEAQWEYACRAGTETAFNWGTDYIDDSKANYNASYVDANNTTAGTYLYIRTEVGSYAPNAWDLYDMHGNVGEWCWDWYGRYSSEAQTDPTGAVSGTGRVVRGGSNSSYGETLRSACQFGYDPAYASGCGFRVTRP